jgi:hypothetical protein
VHAARGRDHNYVSGGATGHAHEALEDPAVIFLVLGTTDGNDPTARRTFWNFTWHKPFRLSSRNERRAQPGYPRPPSIVSQVGSALDKLD